MCHKTKPNQTKPNQTNELVQQMHENCTDISSRKLKEESEAPFVAAPKNRW